MPTSNHRSIARAAAGARRRILRALAPSIVAVGTTAALWGSAFAEPFVRIEGVDVALRGDPDRALDAFEEGFLDEEVTLDAGVVITHAARRDLGIRLAREPLVRRLAALRGAFARSPSAWLATLSGAPVAELALDTVFEEEPAFAYVARLREEVDAAPVAPRGDRLDAITPGRPGRMLDMLQAMRVLRRATTDQAYFVLPVEALPPPPLVTRRRADADFRHVLASIEERYRVEGDAFARASNVERAAQALDGAILDPGAELSFNAIVGERTLGRGFLPATEIVSGRRVQGIGGGICQVAGAVYAVASRGGLDVEEHHAHSIPPRGRGARRRDTAVAWGLKDLRIRNPFRFHVRLTAKAEGGALRVELRGERPSAVAGSEAPPAGASAGPFAALEPRRGATSSRDTTSSP
jgi:hypothetical protein